MFVVVVVVVVHVLKMHIGLFLPYQSTNFQQRCDRVSTSIICLAWACDGLKRDLKPGCCGAVDSIVRIRISNSLWIERDWRALGRSP